jgi:hypothetical protein
MKHISAQNVAIVNHFIATNFATIRLSDLKIVQNVEYPNNYLYI